MATTTRNYGFKKPQENDFYSIEDQNRNWDLADSTIANVNSDLSAISSSLALKGTDIYIRKGNIVEASLINTWLNQRNVPIGYRPAGMRHFILWDSTVSFFADVYYDNGRFVSGDHNYTGTMVWITTDPMPV